MLHVHTKAAFKNAVRRGLQGRAAVNLLLPAEQSREQGGIGGVAPGDDAVQDQAGAPAAQKNLSYIILHKYFYSEKPRQTQGIKR